MTDTKMLEAARDWRENSENFDAKHTELWNDLEVAAFASEQVRERTRRCAEIARDAHTIINFVGETRIIGGAIADLILKTVNVTEGEG